MARKVEIELVRRDKGSEQFALPATRQEYLLRREDGSYGAAELDWDTELLNDMGLLYRGERDRTVAQRVGDRLARLMRQLDWGEARAQLLDSLATGERTEIVVRSFAAELYSLPWELMTLEGTGESLGEVNRALLRYELPAAKPAVVSWTDAEGERILYAWSAAGGRVPQEAHGKAIADAALAGDHPFDLAKDTVPNASLARIVEAMKERPPAVLHLLCHGGTVGTAFGLVLDGVGGGEVVDPGTLRQTLAPFLPKLRLVVLSACHGGHSGPVGNHLGSTAQALHRLGVPAVISSRFPLSVLGSIDLAQVLWKSLLVDLKSLEEAFLSARVALESRTTALDWASLQLWCHRGSSPDIRPLAERPYRGLRSFRSQDSRFFFGRERECEELVRRVREPLPDRPHLIVLAGASGSGKSSVVQAGLLPALQSRADERWTVVSMRPGTGAPLRTLARGLGDEASEDPTTQASLLVTEPDQRLLVIVDQFEEVFTHPKAREQGDAFTRVLGALAELPKVSVLLSMRVDYFARCSELNVNRDTPLLRVVYDDQHRMFVGPMDDAGLEAAIREPPARVGLVLEQGLTEALLREVRDQPGALPLLEYALDLLWERRDGHLLRHSTYQELGGVEGALTRTADKLVESLSPEVLAQTRRLFVELVDLGADENFATRRRVIYDEVRPSEEAERAAFDAAVEGVVKLHLVVAGEEPTVPPQRWLDLAHEALIRRWTLLHTWIDADRERTLAVRKVRGWAEETRGDPKAVLEASRLGYAVNVLHENRDALGPEAVALVERSEKASNRRRRWERLAAIALVVLALIVAGYTTLTEQAAVRAKEEAIVASGKAAAAQQQATGAARRALNATRLSAARGMRERSPTRALMLLRDVELTPASFEMSMKILSDAHWSEEAIILLHRPFSQAIYSGHTQSVFDAEFSADSSHVVTASQDGTARIWTRDNRAPAVVLQHDEPLRRVMYMDPDHILTGGARGGVWLWSLGDKEPEKRLIARHGTVITDIDSDGHWVLTASEDGNVRLWFGPSKEPVQLPHPQAVWSVDSSVDGDHIASACEDGLVRIWSIAHPEKPMILRGHRGPAVDVDYSPNGTRLVSAGSDGQAIVWDTRTGRIVQRYSGHAESINGAEYSPNGDRILTWSNDGSVRIWSTTRNAPPIVLDDIHSAIAEAAWSPDGERVLAGSASGDAAIWRSDGRSAPRFLPGHTDRVGSAAFSTDEQWVVTASNDGDARCWSANPDDTLVALRPINASIQALDTAPDGRIVTAGSDGKLRIYLPDGIGPIEEIQASVDSAVTIATWDAKGQRIASSSDDGTIHISYPGTKNPPIVLQASLRPMTNVSWHPADPSRFLATSEDGKLYLWDLDNSREPTAIPLTDGKIWAAEYTPSGSEIVVTTDDGNLIRLPSDGRRVAANLGAGRTSTLYVLAMHPEGKEVAFSTQDGGIWVRSLIDPNATDRRIGLHSGPAFDLRYSADGAKVLSASYDGTVGLWDVASGTGRTLRGHSSAVQSAAFLPDGLHVVSGCADGSATIWSLELFEVDTGDVYNAVQSSTTGCIGAAEITQYLRMDLPEAELATAQCEARMGRLAPEDVPEDVPAPESTPDAATP